MKCKDCPRLFEGTDEKNKTFFVCIPKGTIVENPKKEFEKCEYRK